MPDILTEQDLRSELLQTQIARMSRAFDHWFIDSMVPYTDAFDLAMKLYYAPFALFSIDHQDNPHYNFMNLRAQRLFEMPWDAIPQMALIHSVAIQDIESVLNFTNLVRIKGKYVNYTAPRLSSQGHAFRLENAYVWAVQDADGSYRGQAYMEPLF